MPDESRPKSLRKLIGHLPAFKSMGEIDPQDIFHSFRSFKSRMLPWIENLICLIFQKQVQSRVGQPC